MAAQPEEVGAPPEYFTRARWVRSEDAEWAMKSDELLVKHGAVYGPTIYAKHHVARQRARRLKQLIVRLRLKEEWEMREHVERKDGGWIWIIEYIGGPNARRTEDRRAG